jgi:hypothetical protein
MLNLKGKRFGKLTVKALTAQRKKGSVVWRCLCDCGNVHFVAAKHLVHNHTGEDWLCTNVMLPNVILIFF